MSNHRSKDSNIHAPTSFPVLALSFCCLMILPCCGFAQDRYPLVPSGESAERTARLDSNDMVPLQEAPGFFEPTRILATVAGRPIFVGDLLGDANLQIERLAAKAPEHIKEQARSKLIKQMLPLAIEQKLIYVDMTRSLPDPKRIASLRKDITDQFDKLQLPRMMEQLEAESRDDLDAKLRALESSIRAMREKWVDNQMVSIYIQQFVNDTKTITRQEMLDRYNEQKPDYSFPAQVRWEELMVSYSKAGSKENAWTQIAEMGNEVIYGAKLSEVAKEKSHGFGASKGGQHSWTTAGSIKHDEIDNLLFELPINVLSDVIETDQGYHIIRVLERKQAGHIPFSEAQAKIKKTMEAEYKKKRLAEYLDKLKRELPVEIYDEDVAKSFLR